MATKSEMDLAQIFQAVSKTMLQNQTALNEADTYNHDHGDNMVQIFNLATKAMQAKQDATPAEQLAFAGKQVQSNLHSGSAGLYADGFLRASQQFQGQQNITADNVMTLIQALMGSSQSAQPVQPVQPAQQAPQAAADPLAALLGTLGSSMAGQAPQSQASDGLDAGDLITAGIAFLQSQQRGESTMESLLNALMAGSQMSSSPDRDQSGRLVANTLMQVVGSMMKK
jgi:hypothetical protein